MVDWSLTISSISVSDILVSKADLTYFKALLTSSISK